MSGTRGGPGVEHDRVLAVVGAAAADAVREAAARAEVGVEIVHGLPAAFAALGRGPFRLTLLSLDVEHADAATAGRLAGEAKAGRLLLSAAGASLERALEARALGAAGVLREPLDPDELAAEIARSVRPGDAVPLPDVGEEASAIVGSGRAMAAIFETVARVAPTPATVLLSGESGTGKELLARALHDASQRAAGPFVAVNCAAIPEHLLESELFGHERGAFTGAVARKPGRFERAHGGTLFLDEIGDMSLVLQAKILRALEEREVERVGGEGPLPVDVRVVAATHRDLGERIAEGEFREDLYYRLAVVTLPLPPLRERAEDVEELALHFAARFARRYQRPVRGLGRDALARLRAYPWPGNVRELRNVMDRAVLLAGGAVIRADDLRLGEASPSGAPPGGGAASGYPPTLSLAEVEARHIERVLRHTDRHMGDAADILGIHRNTLTRKVRDYGLGEEP